MHGWGNIYKKCRQRMHAWGIGMHTNNIHCWDVWHTLGGKYSMYTPVFTPLYSGVILELNIVYTPLKEYVVLYIFNCVPIIVLKYVMSHRHRCTHKFQ